MKSLLILGLLAFSSFSFAICSPDASIVEKQIRKAENCHQSTQIATDCAWGSNVDIGLAAAAAEKCEQGFGGRSKLSKSDKALLKKMEDRCGEAWSVFPGSLARSANAHCRLKAIEFLHNILTAGT